MNIILTSIKAMPEMSTVHGTSPVFLGSFVLRNEQHWEHAAPFFCKACQRCSLMDHNSPLWEVVTPPEMGENREGSVAVDLCSVGQMQERSSHRAQPAQHPWAYWISGRHKKDVSSREAEALSPIPTVPRQASCSGKSDPAHVGAPSARMKGLRNQRRQELCWGPSLFFSSF